MKNIMKIKSVLELLENIYLNDLIFNDNIIKYIIGIQNDPYLKYHELNNYISIFELMGIKVKYLNNEMYLIEGFICDKYNILHENDIIFQINNKSILDFNPTKNNINNISIYALRNYGKPDVVIVKEKSNIPQLIDRSEVKSFIVEDYCYLNIPNLDANIVSESIDILYNFSDLKIPYLVIDLRENMGGSISNVVNIISKFTKYPTHIYSEVDKNNNKIDIYTSETKNYIKFQNIYVLINNNTISSAELMCLILKDSLGAYVIGKKSYGKGVICKQISLNDDFILKIPKYTYLTIYGKSINNIGIYPDYEVDDMIIEQKLKEKKISELISCIIK